MTLVGVDGCRGGWVAVVEAPSRLEAIVAERFDLLLERLPDDALVAVDVPIGLTSAGPRAADMAARRLLGRPRASSVFPAPIRAVLGAGGYEEACELHQQADGRKISRQAFGILAKILEVDRVMRSARGMQERVREVHPEVSFALWGGAAMAHRKASAPGRAEREALIDSRWPDQRELLLGNVRRAGCAPDDLNDAFAALWTARRIRNGDAVLLPDPPPVDDAGFRMEIVA